MPDQDVMERNVNIMARAMYESDRRAGTLDAGESWSEWESHYYRLAHDAMIASLQQVIEADPWLEHGGRVRKVAWAIANFFHAVLVTPFHNFGEWWAKRSWLRDFRKQHEIEPTHFDSAGKEWVSRCSCGWWCRAGARRTVESHEYAHWKAAREGPEAMAAESRRIIEGTQSEWAERVEGMGPIRELSSREP
jgi:hypothetical protein